MRALIVGSYGAGNIGDEATLNVISEQLQAQRYDVSYTCYGGNTDKALNIWNPLLLLKSIIRSDLVAFCGGLLSAHTGPFQRIFPAIGLFAKVLRKRLEFRSVSFLVTQGISSAMFRLAMSHADYVSVRDVISKRNFPSGILEIDLTYYLRTERIPFPYNSRLLVGVALRPTREMANLLDILQWLVSTGKLVIFVPFCYHRFTKSEDDYSFAVKLKNLLRNDSFIVLKTHKPEQIKYLMGKMDVILGSRFHSLLFASQNSVPVIPLVCDSKIRSFAETYHANSIITPDTSLNDFIKVFQRVIKLERRHSRHAQKATA